MHKKFAVFMLAARASLWRILAVMAAAAAAQTGLVFWEVRRAAETGPVVTPEMLFDGGVFQIIWLVALVTVTFLLCTPLGSGCGQMTLCRLPVRRWWMLVQWCLYGLAAYAVVWALELAVLLGLSCLVLLLEPATAASGQAVFLASYRSGLLHSLLPLDDGAVWFGTTALFAGLGVSTSAAAVAQMRNGRWMYVLLLVAMFGGKAMQPVGDSAGLVLMGLVSLGMAVWGLAVVWKEERP